MRGSVRSLAICVQAKAERKVEFCRQEKGDNDASNRVVRGSKQVSMYEMRKRKQIPENARQM